MVYSFYFLDSIFGRTLLSLSLLTEHFLLQNLIKTCLFFRGLFCAKHCSAFILIFRALLRPIYIYFESFYFNFFVKKFIKLIKFSMSSFDFYLLF